MNKKIVSMITAIVMFITMFSALPAGAAEYSEEELQKNILQVKELFAIPDDFDTFNSYVYSYYEDSGDVWEFSWSWDTKGEYLNIQVDSEGNLRSYRFDTSADNELPKKNPEYYKSTAVDFIKKYAPKVDGHIKYNGFSIGPYNHTYCYDFIREENGIPVSDNSVTIEVDYITNKVRYAWFNWDYKLTFDAPKGILSKEEAAAKLNKDLEMELYYYNGYGDNESKVFLAYIPSQYYLAVDAFTGEVYDTRYYYNDYNEYKTETMAGGDVYAEGSKTDRGDTNGGAVLTEKEIEKIQELADLISKEDAIKVVTSDDDLLLADSYTYTNARLETYSDQYVWHIDMRDARPYDYRGEEDPYRPYLYARVDAQTGKLLSFESSVKSYYDFANIEDAKNTKLKLSKSQCLKTLEKFLKEKEPEKFEKTKEDGKYDGYSIYYDYEKNTEVAGGMVYTFSRVENGVLFRNNYLNGGVDRVTGKIFRYNCSWNDDLKFPSVEGVMTPEEARKAYLSLDHFALRYEVVNVSSYDEDTYMTKQEQYSRLVYPAQLNSGMIDPFSGGLIGYDGEPYVETGSNGEFADIEGHKYEIEIMILNSFVGGGNTSKFRPDDKITGAELAAFVERLFSNDISSKIAEAGTKTVSRQKLAKYITECVNLDKLAKEDIFKTIFKDDAKIGKSYKGAAAICDALGYMEATKKGNFRPKTAATRAEAACAIVRAYFTRYMR